MINKKQYLDILNECKNTLKLYLNNKIKEEELANTIFNILDCMDTLDEFKQIAEIIDITHPDFDETKRKELAKMVLLRTERLLIKLND